MRYNTDDYYESFDEIRTFDDIDNFDEDPCFYGGHEFDEDGICVECGRIRVDEDENEEMLYPLRRALRNRLLKHLWRYERRGED
jgi:hypothetical protein